MFSIHCKYTPHLDSCNRYKSNLLTTLRTGVLTQIVARYINNGSSVYACFLDASKAIDLVRHDILFQQLLSCDLPSPVVRLPIAWYKLQNTEI